MDGSAVVTHDSALIVSVEKQYIAGPGGVMKLDPSKTGVEAVRWYFPVPDFEFTTWQGGIIGSVGINDHYTNDPEHRLAAFTGIDGRLHVVRHGVVIGDSAVLGPDSLTHHPTPPEIFSYDIGPSISTPIFTGDKLVAASYKGVFLFAYDSLLDFKLVDSFAGPFEATPIVWDGRLYLASRNGYLYCLGESK
jgi:outer membrane protein assembly factor BamB